MSASERLEVNEIPEAQTVKNDGKFLEMSCNRKFQGAPEKNYIVKLKPSVPSTPNQEWQEAINTFWGSPIELRGFEKVEAGLAKLHLQNWLIAFHWFIRLDRIDPKHKVPGSRSSRNLIKPAGEMLKALSRMCERIHYLQEEGSGLQHYPHARALFLAVLSEIIEWQVFDAIAPQEEKPKGRSKKNPKVVLSKSPKEAALQPIKDVISCLDHGVNPYDPELQPHQHELIEACFSTLRRVPGFKHEHWDKYLSSCRAFVRGLDGTGWAAIRNISEDGVSISRGQGRGTQTIRVQKLIPEPVAR